MYKISKQERCDESWPCVFMIMFSSSRMIVHIEPFLVLEAGTQTVLSFVQSFRSVEP